MYYGGRGGGGGHPPQRVAPTTGSPHTGYGYVPGLSNTAVASPHGGALVGPPHCDPCAPCREGGRTKLRVINAIINGPQDGYDISLEGITPFKGVTSRRPTEYVWVNAGRQTVTVRKTGLNDTVMWPDLVMGENYFYTLLLVGDTNEPNDSDFKPQVMLFEDHNIAVEQDTRYPNVGYANVRFVHASPNSPNVDLLKGAQRIFENVPYGDTDSRKYHAYQRFPAVNRATGRAYRHDISLVQHAAAAAATTTKPIVLTAPFPVEFACDVTYTIWAFGKYNDASSPLQLVITVDWPEAKPDPREIEEENLTESERRLHEGLSKRVQRSDQGIYAKKPEKQGDGVDGFGLAGIAIGQQFYTPTEPGVSFANEKGDGAFKDYAIVRMIHSLGKIGASLAIEDEPVVKNLAHGRVTEPLQLHPGNYNVKMFAGANMIGEQMIDFEPGSIYTVTARVGNEMNVHVDRPDRALSHIKMLSLSEQHGALSSTESFEEHGVHPVTIFGRTKEAAGATATISPLMGPRPLVVPERSHVTVFLVDHNGKMSASTQTCQL